jgi:hypothetical protein
VCNSNFPLACPAIGNDFISANSNQIEVDNNTCFHNGDLVIAVRTITQDGTPPILAGTGCVLQVTHDPVAPAAGTNAVIETSSTLGLAWNPAWNHQCDSLNAVWNDGYTMVKHFRTRAYRIKPGASDTRGVLQLSTDGMTTWQDVALGVIDLQLALRLAHDPTQTIEWLSGDAMNAAAVAALGNPQLLMVAVTLVAKTTKSVDGPSLTQVPTLMDPSVSDPDHNPLSDKGPVALPVSDPSVFPANLYDTGVVYRIYTTTIDLRNVGVGVDGHP